MLYVRASGCEPFVDSLQKRSFAASKFPVLHIPSMRIVQMIISNGNFFSSVVRSSDVALSHSDVAPSVRHVKNSG